MELLISAVLRTASDFNDKEPKKRGKEDRDGFALLMLFKFIVDESDGFNVLYNNRTIPF